MELWSPCLCGRTELPQESTTADPILREQQWNSHGSLRHTSHNWSRCRVIGSARTMLDLQDEVRSLFNLSYADASPLLRTGKSFWHLPQTVPGRAICRVTSADYYSPLLARRCLPASSLGTSANSDSCPDVKVSLASSSGLCSRITTLACRWAQVVLSWVVLRDKALPISRTASCPGGLNYADHSHG